MSGSLLNSVMAAVIYSCIGVAMFALVFLIAVKVVPFSIRKEIEEDQNIALGIVLGSIIIGLSMIVSAAIHG